MLVCCQCKICKFFRGQVGLTCKSGSGQHFHCLLCVVASLCHIVQVRRAVLLTLFQGWVGWQAHCPVCRCLGKHLAQLCKLGQMPLLTLHGPPAQQPPSPLFSKAQARPATCPQRIPLQEAAMLCPRNISCLDLLQLAGPLLSHLEIHLLDM